MTTGLVGQHQLTPFTAPVPGDPLNATVVLGNDNDTVTAYDAHDDDSTIHFQSSVLASRPPASIAGQKWLTTDAAARYLYYDTGSAWVEVNYFRDSGGIITGAVTISDTTESTSTTTGALIVSGGVGIAKNVFIGGTLGVTGVATLTAQPIISSLTASKPVFTDASKGLVSTGTLGTDQGGTNLTTYTAGDILYASATNVLSKLAIGTTGQHLIVTAGLPAWGTDTALGTVTSVGWTGGLVSVATATTTPAFTVAGTSGGVVYFSSASTWASSAALTQYGVVYGGGAGATPVATAAGTTGQVLTAVTSGAPVWSATYAGTVTSVGFTGGLISVASATTTPALTVAGTSGGVVYFSSASTWASSAALTASAIVLGGGAGAAPATTTTGTGVVTALGVNVGTAGAFVVNGGALGTPSSGAVAASLITAGTFGAGAYTFPGALAITGAFTGATTGAFSSTVTLQASIAFAASAGQSAGSIAKNATYGLTYYGVAGSSYDFALLNSNGSLVAYNATGTQNIAFAGTLAVTGAATFSSSLAISGAFTGATTGAFSGTVTGQVAGVFGQSLGSAISTIQVHNAATDKPFIGFYRGGTLRSALYLFTDGDFRLTDSSLVANAGLTIGALTATTGAFTKATYGDVITFTNGGSTPKTGYLYSDTTYAGFFNGAGATGDGILLDATSHNLYLETNSVVRLTINSSGAATFSSTLGVTGNVTMGASGAANSILTLNAASASGYATLLFQSASVGKWYVGRGVSDLSDNFQITTGAVAIALSINNSTRAVAMPAYGAGAATFDASGNITSTSDTRHKVLQGTFGVGLSELCTIDPILYKWNKASGNEMEHTYAGFSAQNLKAASEYFCGVRTDGILSMQDRAILAACVNAIKELDARASTITALTARVAALEAH